ncbi:MAG: hypothetical protein KIG60_09190, partial [Caryophanon sp.]|nr:hypothetical protein [Caryophanon sp.]
TYILECNDKKGDSSPTYAWSHARIMRWGGGVLAYILIKKVDFAMSRIKSIQKELLHILMMK